MLLFLFSNLYLSLLDFKNDSNIIKQQYAICLYVCQFVDITVLSSSWRERARRDTYFHIHIPSVQRHGIC